MIAMLRIARLQTIEIGRELDQPVFVPRRLGDIGDDLVGRQIGIDREIRLADDALVRAGGGERLAVQNIAALGDFDADERCRQQSGKKNGQNPRAFEHGNMVVHSGGSRRYGCPAAHAGATLGAWQPTWPMSTALSLISANGSTRLSPFWGGSGEGR